MSEDIEHSSALEERRQELQQEFKRSKMRIVRNELFPNLRDPAVTIRNGNITFNTACINGLEDVVYVNLMIDEENNLMGVEGCGENDKEALRWCVAKTDKRKSRKMKCPLFTDLLYRLMDWDEKYRYKVLGYLIEDDGKPLYVFDLTVHQVFHEKPKKGEEPEGEPVDTRKGFFPEDIANSFGIPYEEHVRQKEVMKNNRLVPVGGVADAVQRDALTEDSDTPGEES